VNGCPWRNQPKPGQQERGPKRPNRQRSFPRWRQGFWLVTVLSESGTVTVSYCSDFFLVLFLRGRIRFRSRFRSFDGVKRISGLWFSSLRWKEYLLNLKIHSSLDDWAIGVMTVQVESVIETLLRSGIENSDITDNDQRMTFPK
jgi:hypothetical protein